MLEADLATLEGLVDQASRRIEELTEERDRLVREVAELRRRLEAGDAESRQSDDLEKAWRSERRHVIAELRQALGELRAE